MKNATYKRLKANITQAIGGVLAEHAAGLRRISVAEIVALNNILNTEKPTVFATNELVIAVPAGSTEIDSIDDLDHRALWRNVVTWAAAATANARSQGAAEPTWATTDDAWARLADAGPNRARTHASSRRSWRASDRPLRRGSGCGIRASRNSVCRMYS